MKVTHIVVHYSATFPDMDVTAAQIDRWHRERGFAKIGYHYFIRRDGTVEKGRADTEVGAHVAGQNTGKLGICWAGGLERGKPGGHKNMAPAQEKALIGLIKSLLVKYPAAKVVGHRDLAATECPGFAVQPWWAAASTPPAAPAPDPNAARPFDAQAEIADIKRRLAALEGR